jgi:hypothetical protein
MTGERGPANGISRRSRRSVRRLGAFAVITLALLGTGCSSAPISMAPLSAPVRQVISEPRLHEIVQRSVGESIHSIRNFEKKTLPRLTESVTIDVVLGDAFLPAGTVLAAGTEHGASVYCTAERLGRFGNLSSRICLRDTASRGAFDEWRAPEGPPARVVWVKLAKPAAYGLIETTEDIGGFQYELLYQGVAENVVRILYREFIDDRVRPAFQQDLSYTLAPEGPTEVSFRSTRLRIHSADNNSIRYEILSGMTAPPSP